MLVSSSQARRDEPVEGFRFEGVILDLRQARLVVDGAEVPAGPLPLRLLETMCRAQGALVPRKVLFETIWPRQAVSDEALTKLVGRTRELLGPYGALLTTVRGQGLRLDTLVEPMATATRAAASPQEPKARSIRARWIAAASGVVIALTMLGLWLHSHMAPRGDAPVMEGYALLDSDAQASSPETLAALRLAEAAADLGDVRREQDILTGLAARDRASPIAPLVLAMVENAKAKTKTDARARWAAEGAARLRDDSTLYVRLLADYAQALGSEGDAARSKLDALVALRPHAWRLQLRRAHADLAKRNLQGALTALRTIPMQDPPPMVLLWVLDDRIALGDAAAVQSALSAGLLSDQPLERGILQAHLLSRDGDWRKAVEQLDRLIEQARAQHAFTIAAKACDTAALTAYRAGLPGAKERLLSAARAQAEDGFLLYIAEDDALAAELAMEAGDKAQATQLLADAAAAVQLHTQPLALEILNARLRVRPIPAFTTPADLDERAWPNGEGHLVKAWIAYAGGDVAAANAELEAADRNGIVSTYFGEDASLLRVMLRGNSTDTDCKVDPPYPNYLRLSACRALLRQLPRSGAPDQ